MTREEAITTLKEMHDSFDEIHENTNFEIGYEQMTALDMAIEALSKPNYETDTEVRLAVTNRKKEKVILCDAFGEVEYYPIEALKGGDAKMSPLQKPSTTPMQQSPSNGADLISRADAVKELTEYYDYSERICIEIKALIEDIPSADAVDCTDFIDWIRKVVADEELWDLNAVGYGEIICRKLVEIGALATTEKPPYYYVPSADTVSREDYEDIIKDYRKQYENMNNEIADLEAKLADAEESYLNAFYDGFNTATLALQADAENPSAEAIHIHNDGTLEVKVPIAQKVGRVLVMDTDSHIGGGLFYPDDAVHIETYRELYEKYMELKHASANAVQGYTEWLEKIIVDNEGANEWLCEDTPDLEWCEKNCHYSSIQAECLRYLYAISKGGDTE